MRKDNRDRIKDYLDALEAVATVALRVHIISAKLRRGSVAKATPPAPRGSDERSHPRLGSR